jgi:hypothetical protein
VRHESHDIPFQVGDASDTVKGPIHVDVAVIVTHLSIRSAITKNDLATVLKGRQRGRVREVIALKMGDWAGNYLPAPQASCVKGLG